MRRRELLLVLGGALMASPVVRAQQRAMPVIGALNIGSPPANLGNRLNGPIHQGMREEGFVEGQNMLWEPRWADFHGDRLPALAADLVSRKVDVIITAAGYFPALAAKNATSTIPIIFTNVADPVGFGLVASLARPGGNLTGFSDLNVELIPKRLELLCELVPKAAVIAQLIGSNSEIAKQLIATTQEAARAKDIKVVVLTARTATEIDAAFEQSHADALLIQATPFLSSRRDQLVALAARHAVPAMYFDRSFVVGGGLISYGADLDVLFRQAGVYAGKILKGAKPADLPVQQPTTFKLVVNLTTAKSLGLTIPTSILARADEVIE
jgi:putative ABC transport system substrate-binding protein